VSEKSKGESLIEIAEGQEKFVLAASLIPVRLGDVFLRLPTHLTMVPPVYMNPSQKREFDVGFAEVAEENLPFTIHANGPEYFGPKNDIEVLPISGVFFSAFAGAAMLAKRMGLPYDDTFSFKFSPKTDESVAMSFGTGDEVDTCGGLTCVSWNDPHVTDFEGIIEPGETRRLYEVQLFALQGLKRVVSVYRQDGFEYEQE